MKMIKVRKEYASRASITASTSRKDNTLESYIEDKRLQRRKEIKARRNRTSRYREKIESIVNI